MMNISQAKAKKLLFMTEMYIENDKAYESTDVRNYFDNKQLLRIMIEKLISEVKQNELGFIENTQTKTTN